MNKEKNESIEMSDLMKCFEANIMQKERLEPELKTQRKRRY